jgi:hypothetical protein
MQVLINLHKDNKKHSHKLESRTLTHTPNSSQTRVERGNKKARLKITFGHVWKFPEMFFGAQTFSEIPRMDFGQLQKFTETFCLHCHFREFRKLVSNRSENLQN